MKTLDEATRIILEKLESSSIKLVLVGMPEEFDCGWIFGYNSYEAIIEGKKHKRLGGNLPYFVDKFDGKIYRVQRIIDFKDPSTSWGGKHHIWITRYKAQKYPNGLPPKGKANPKFEKVEGPTVLNRPGEKKWWQFWK